MKREDIANMTPGECLDETVFASIKNKLKRVREMHKNSDRALASIYQALDDMCIDSDTPIDTESADTLGEAINCYVQYGEGSLSKLMSVIKARYIDTEEE